MTWEQPPTKDDCGHTAIRADYTAIMPTYTAKGPQGPQGAQQTVLTKIYCSVCGEVLYRQVTDA